MSYEKLGDASSGRISCHYGQSRLAFRGPKKELNTDYVAILGGSDTFGKYVEVPYPALLEQASGVDCINFGLINAGVDVFLNDPALIDMARNGRLTVLQVTGAQNNSNRLYSVHPRRNDRFVKASKLMKQMFCELDFTEYHFTRHLLQAAQARAPDRYRFLCAELRLAWVARMTELVQRIGGKILLLWFAEHPPDGGETMQDPLLITRAMIEQLRPLVSDVVEVVAGMTGPGGPVKSALSHHHRMAQAMSWHMLPDQAHELAAAQLAGPIERLLST